MSNFGKMKSILIKEPLKLDCGKEISNFPLAYETYGNLNEKKDNAILMLRLMQQKPMKGKELRLQRKPYGIQVAVQAGT